MRYLCYFYMEMNVSLKMIYYFSVCFFDWFSRVLTFCFYNGYFMTPYGLWSECVFCLNTDLMETFIEPFRNETA